MAAPLAPLRTNLDLMPSPLPEHPGLLVRDPLRFSDATIIIPPPVVPLLALFDGRHDELDLAAALVRATGELVVRGLVRQLVDALSRAGMLQDEVFARRREERFAAFARSAFREAAHAGSAYPAEADALGEALRRYLDGVRPGTGSASAGDGAIGVAAPHVSLEGGWQCYRDAYAALAREPVPQTVVVLGTSHYGEPERFGLTRKPFQTPLGAAPVDLEAVGFLEAEGGPAVQMEDYCHSVEHSIEFQVVFLQHLLGPGVPIVPILCGPFARAGQPGGVPEDDPGVERFLAALARLGAGHGKRLFWVLGVDLAHMGRRYGDPFAARAEMVEVAARDRARLARVAEGDAAGLWELVRDGGDDLKWCGASALYAFLRAAAPVRAELLRYEQWNIDRDSVVSFAGLSFSRPA